MGIFDGNFDVNDVIQIFTKVFIVFLILPVHEFAHAWAAHDTDIVITEIGGTVGDIESNKRYYNRQRKFSMGL